MTATETTWTTTPPKPARLSRSPSSKSIKIYSAGQINVFKGCVVLATYEHGCLDSRVLAWKWRPFLATVLRISSDSTQYLLQLCGSDDLAFIAAMHILCLLVSKQISHPAFSEAMPKFWEVSSEPARELHRDTKSCQKHFPT